MNGGVNPDKSQNTSSNGASREPSVGEDKGTNYRKKISVILQSKPFEYFIISLIGIYCILVIVNFAISDFASDENTKNNIDTAKVALLYVELVILIFFSIEILLNIYVFGFRVSNKVKSDLFSG